MSKNTEEWLQKAMEDWGEVEVTVNVIITAMEYIENELMDGDSPEDLLSLDHLNDMLCDVS